MRTIFSVLTFLTFLFMFMFANSAWAGGAPAASSSFSWEDSSIKQVAKDFVMQVGQDQYQQAYDSASPDLQQGRSASEFTEDMKSVRFDQVKDVKWDSAIPALPANGGFKLRGSVTLDDDSVVPVYVHLKGNAHLPSESRLVCPEDKPSCAAAEKHIADWDSSTEWTVLDYRSGDAMTTRMSEGRMTPLDTILLVFTTGLALGFLGLIYYYIHKSLFP